MKMNKNKIKKEDGRYLVFYTFDDVENDNTENKTGNKKEEDKCQN